MNDELLDEFEQEQEYFMPWGMEVNQYCMFMHLSQYAGFIVPYAGLGLPIVMWLTNKDKSELVDRHGKSILNWIISSTIYLIASVILMFLFIGFITLFALVVCYLIFTILGAISASNGKVYKYPLSITFVK
jgi:uncharacterized Tic20 family protein